MSDSNFPNAAVELYRDQLGRLMLVNASGAQAEEVSAVRAFPLSAADEGVSLLGSDGHERLWIARLTELPAPQRELVGQALAEAEFMPAILRIRSVSTFSTPSTWAVDTDRGATELVLKGEEDIRRLADGGLLISDAQGLPFAIPDPKTLDRHSRKLLERFL